MGDSETVDNVKYSKMSFRIRVVTVIFAFLINIHAFFFIRIYSIRILRLRLGEILRIS